MLTRRQLLLGGLLLPATAMPAFAAAPRLTARHAFIGNYRDTLLEIDADKPVQIASITKLITAWVVLNADLSLTEKLKVTDEDVRFSHYTQSSLPVGTVWRREELLEWLLVTSDNRAAATLSRTFPGGWTEFQYEMRALMTQMQLFSFDFGDSSGLSNMNMGSARDLGYLLVTLSQLTWFQRHSRKTAVGGKMNVNRFAHDQSVGLLAGKTGFTSAAGYCLAEAEQFGEKVMAMVVLKSADRESRAQDMNKLRRFAREQLATAEPY